MFNVKIEFQVPSNTMMDARNDVSEVEEAVRRTAVSSAYKMHMVSTESDISTTTTPVSIDDVIAEVKVMLDRQVVLLGDILDRVPRDAFVYIHYCNIPNHDIASCASTIQSLERYNSLIRYSQVLDIAAEDSWLYSGIRLSAIMPSTLRTDLHKLKST